ncbi:MAG: nucleotidyltransferase family protein [Thermoplasmata archaeon]
MKDRKTLSEITEVLRNHEKELKKRYSIKEIGVFGSYLRGDAKEESDLDVLVEFEKPIGFFKFLELEEHLSDLIGIKVDLVSKKALKPHIGQRILEEVAMI